MKPTYKGIALAVALTLMAADGRAEVVTEATLGSGYQGNIFSDSSTTGDVRTTAGAGLRYYPAASTELAGAVQYSAFSSTRDLSSLAGELSATIIPISGPSRVSPSMSASISTRRFGTAYEAYDQWSGSGGIGLLGRLASWIQIGSQGTYSVTEYYNSAFGSNQGISVRGDLHLTPLGSNAISVGLDHSRRAFDMPYLVTVSGEDSYETDQVRSETFAASGLQLRYSRPLGARTGLSLSAGRRFMNLDDDYVVPGYTVDFLSPWADLWSGPSLSGSIKHFFPRQLTTAVSVSYVDKEFVDALEADATGSTYERYSRDDQMFTASITLARPVTLGGGALLTPTLEAGYRDNRSSLALFTYEDLWATFSLSAGF